MDKSGMGGYVLFDGHPHVAVDGSGPRSLLEVKDGGTTRFWTDTSDLEGILGGGSLLLSALGGSCEIRAQGKIARLEYSGDGQESENCEFSLEKLADALARVRESNDSEDEKGVIELY